MNLKAIIELLKFSEENLKTALHHIEVDELLPPEYNSEIISAAQDGVKNNLPIAIEHLSNTIFSLTLLHKFHS